LKIAVVTTSWPEGPDDPSGHFVRAEADALAADGHEVVPIFPRPGGAFGWPGFWARVRRRPWVVAHAARFVVDARARLTHPGEFDRVVAHWAVPCAFPIASGSLGASGMTGTAGSLEVVSHGADVRLIVRLPRPLRERVVAAIAARARPWRFVSQALLASLCEAIGPRVRADVEAVARVEPCLVTMPDVSEAARRRRAQVDGTLFVSSGRLVASKRVERAIAYAATVPRATLVVVGDGPERGRLEVAARRAGAKVLFTGLVPRTDALAWIAAADALLHASRAEGFSTVLREAEALGTPTRIV
jgi:glycosyltransferase involved in cell wall biosynthesis